MKKLILFVLVAVMFSCNNSPNQTSKEESNTANTSEEVKVEKGRQTFAVLWNWTTSDTGLVNENIEKITEELMKLWEKDDIENAYFNTDAPQEMLGIFVNISFFIKEKNIEKAAKKLDKLTVVKEGIAEYKLIPVGLLWLGRNSEVIKTKGTFKTYVAVWATNSEVIPSSEDTKAQSDVTLGLWNEGAIENVYFDIEGTQQENTATDFVFFVNAASEDEAISICSNMPFALKNMASYKLHPVGIFWLGQHKK